MKKLLQLSMLLFAAACFGQTSMHRFSFDNTLISSVPSVTLTGTNTTFVADRNAVANNALNITTTTTPAVQSFLSGTIPNMPNGTTSRSFSFWLKLNTNSNGNIFRNGTHSAGGFTPQTSFTLSRIGANFVVWQNNATFMTVPVAYDNNWHFFVLTFNPSTNTMTLYRDDLQIVTTTTQVPDLRTIGNELTIGRGNAGAVEGNFAIDDFRIYEFPLTLSQVEGLFYNQPAPIVAPTCVLNSVSNIGLNTATINFVMNQNNDATSTVIEYGVNTSSTTIVAGPVSHGNGQTLSANMTGLLPNTTYQYRVTSTNSAATTSTSFASFTTRAAATMIYHFEFNNSFASSINAGTLNCTSLPTFTGNGTSPNTAVNINVANAAGRDANTLTANLPLLPIGTAPRSFAFRVLFTGSSFSGENQYVFSAGTGANTQSFDVWSTASALTVNSWGIGNDKFFPTSSATLTNTWYNYAVVYDGTNVSVYRDGTQIGSTQAMNINTIGTALNIGRSSASNFGQGSFRLDDFKVFTGVLSQSEITQLSQSTASLFSSKFVAKNLKITFYPNPTSDVLNIDLATELKSVEIYSLLGQKVHTAKEKQINIANLSKGVYMVRVEDVDGAVATQKLVKE